MINMMKAIKGILKRKNAQIRAEREKFEAERMTNSILAAYLFVFISELGGSAKIPKKSVSEALGRFAVNAYPSDDDYVIEVKELSAKPCGKDTGFGKAGKL